MLPPTTSLLTAHAHSVLARCVTVLARWMRLSSREIDTKMVIAGIFFAAACLSMVNCFDFQLPCDSYLRPSLPEFFTHCCTYSDFSEWKLTSFMSVPTNQCASGSVVVETRVNTVISGDCDNKTEERISECKKYLKRRHL